MRQNIHLQTWREFQFTELILFLLLAAPLIAQAGEIAGVVTNPDTGEPIEDAIVFVLFVPDTEFQPPSEMAKMDQYNYEFVPHVLPILVGTTVIFPNKDQIYHHVYSKSPAKKFSSPLYKGTDAEPVVFDKIGIVKLKCAKHITMSAIVLVLQNPYFGKTDKQGKYTIENVPAGTYKLVVWHEFSHINLDTTAKNIDVAASEQSTVNFSLKIKPTWQKKERSW